MEQQPSPGRKHKQGFLGPPSSKTYIQASSDTAGFKTAMVKHDEVNTGSFAYPDRTFHKF